jgi:AcrR family transcriptional regulator
MQRRLAGVDATRTRILTSARHVLVSGSPFTLDAVARDAGVARLTIYDRFGSRDALLEAVFDDLAESGGLIRLPDAFADPDPLAALEQFLVIFCRFYSKHRLVLRRLNALAVLRPGARAHADRNPRRLQGLRVLLDRVAAAGHPGAGAPDIVHLVHVLTGFAFIDELSGPEGDPATIAPQLVALVWTVVGLQTARGPTSSNASHIDA